MQASNWDPDLVDMGNLEYDHPSSNEARVEEICRVYEELIELEESRRISSSIRLNDSDFCIPLYGALELNFSFYQQKLEALTGELELLYANNFLVPVCQDLESLVRITQLCQQWNDLSTENDRIFNDLEDADLISHSA